MTELPPLYQSPRLTMLVKRWINLKRIKVKNVIERDQHFKLNYKILLQELSVQPAPFEFNNRSILEVISQHFHIKLA